MEIKRFSKKTVRKADVIAFTLFIGIILILINIISSLYFKRIDLTVNKKHSLSSVTEKKLKQLDDVVFIKAFFSKQLPPRFITVRQEVSDFLNDYQAKSYGKLKISYLDPLSSPNLEREALSYGVPQLQFSDIEKDKFQIQNGFLGLVILYEDRFETLPVVENIQNLEYDLTSAILKVLSKTPKNIGLVTFKEEKEVGQVSNDEYRFLKKFLEKQYQIIPVSLKNQDIDKNINTLVVVGEKEKVTEFEKYKIDQFLMSGRGVLFLVNGVSLGEGLTGVPADHNLFDLLEHYGTKVNSDLVLDSYSDIASFQNGYTTFLVPYPFWPKIQRSGFNSKNPITARMETLTLHWPSSISLNKENQKGARYEILIKSSKKSWITSQISNLSPQQKFTPTESDLKESIFSVLITGKLKSFYSGKEIPKPEKEENIKPVQAGLPIKETVNGKIILVSNANFVKDNFLSRSQESLVFFLNAVDYLNSETDLMQIRSKSLSNQPIPELDDNLKQLIKWGNIIAPIILIGIVIFIKKLLENKADKRVVQILSN